VFRHILVPLDGSNLAESALAAAMVLAGALKSTVTLLHIVEKDAPEQIHGQPHLQSPEQAREYLERIRTSLASAGVELHIHVHPDQLKNVARGIVEHEEEFSHDLIVMCTHGRGGASQFLFGSIAQQVIAMGTKPLVMVPARKEEPEAGFSCSTILLPLDGKKEHEQALEPAVEIASACGAELHLFMVVPTLRTLKGNWTSTGRLLPSATSHFLDLSAAYGETYLAEKRAQLAAAGVTVHVEITRGDPVALIVEYAREKKAGLIALGTHARKGVDAFFSASVVNSICSMVRTPLLLVS
jgi:nucleotide-binding universal stress UspA family protein